MSPENRELLVAAETVDPLDLSDHLDSLDLQERQAERSESGNAQRVCVCLCVYVRSHICHAACRPLLRRQNISVEVKLIEVLKI